MKVQDAQTMDMIQSLKPEFRQKYVKNLQGKEYVLYNGLIILAKDKGLKSIQNDILQFPDSNNNFTAIVRSTVIGWDKDPAGNWVEVTYSAIGDANAQSIAAKPVQAHFIRMAETRAKGRALRDYIGIDAVMFEELQDPYEAQPQYINGMNQQQNYQPVQQGTQIPQQNATPTQPPMNAAQVTQITDLKTKLNWTKEQTGNFAQSVCGTNDMSLFSADMAQLLINAMIAEANRVGIKL